jgi:hypothetical protein
MLTEDLERSGAPVPLEQRAGLPDPMRPIQLADGRILVSTRRLPDHPDAPPGSMLGGSAWAGPKGLQVIVTLDHTDAWGPLLHVSLSYAKLSHLPSWPDIVAVKDALFGDVDCCMLLPRKADYVNVRANCFNLWQTPERWGIR